MEASSKRIKIIAIAIVFVVSSGLIFGVKSGCYNKFMPWGNGYKAIVLHAMGDVKFIRGGNDPAAVKIKMELHREDTVITGKESLAVIQINNTGSVTLFSESSIRLPDILEKGKNTRMELLSGSVFSKIKKQLKGNYNVYTKNCIVAVRGTEFLVSFNGSDTEVQLSDGKLLVTSLTDKGDEKELMPGYAALASGDREIQTRRLTEIEDLKLKKYALKPYINNVMDRSSEEIKEIFDNLLSKENEIDDIIKEKIKKLQNEWSRLSPIDRLRSMGKAVSLLHLNGGEKIAGSVTGKEGDSLVVDTGDGVIRVPIDEIIRREELK